MMKRIRTAILFFLFVCCLSPLSLQPVFGQSSGKNYGDLPPDRFPIAEWDNIVWDDPGGWVTVDVSTRGITPDVLDAGAMLQTLIETAIQPTIFYFPPGEYTFKTQVDIKKNDIIIQGAGPAETRIILDGSSPHSIRFIGYDADPVALTANVPPGATSFTAQDVSDLKVGDLVEISQDLPEWDAEWGRNSWGQMVLVTGISGNTVTVDMPLSLGFSLDKQPVYREIHARRNVGVEGFYIERRQYSADSNIQFRSVYNFYAKNIESYNAVKFHIFAYQARKGVISQNYLHDAQNYGTGGHGYGVNLEHLSTEILVTDNIIENLRHHTLVQTGTNHSIISYNYHVALRELTDMSLHGHWSNHNLYEGNMIFWVAIADHWGAVGPENTFYRNRLLGKDDGDDAFIIYDNSDRQNLIGNLLLNGSVISPREEVDDLYNEGNVIGGTAQWESLPATADLPASMYLDAQPWFWPEGLAWPPFGPDLAGSASNTIPAKMRFEGDLGDTNPPPPPPPPDENEAPTIQITSPSSGTVLEEGSSILITANASDSDGSIVGVSFLIDHEIVATDDAAPYELNWPEIAEGTYVLAAQATDDDGAVTLSSEVAVSVIHVDETDAEIQIIGVQASELIEGDLATNTLDGLLNTRWSAFESGAWIEYTLLEPAMVRSIGVAWYKGDRAQSTFDVLGSVDGENWTTMADGAVSSGERRSLEYYPLQDALAVKYVRIVSYGNHRNGRTLISEVVLSSDEHNAYMPGDATGNGAVSAQDAALVLAHTVGASVVTGDALLAADVSGNGSVSAQDASLILQFVTGLIGCFPSEAGCATTG